MAKVIICFGIFKEKMFFLTLKGIFVFLKWHDGVILG